MKQSKKNKLTKEPVINFSHNYHFMVTNLIKITSTRMENFRASLGRRPGGEQSFVWGRYDLLIDYIVYQGKNEMLRSKEFSRGFSFALNDNILQVEEMEEMVEENLCCEPIICHGVKPIFLVLLPLLSKINYLPFKIDVTVNGSIVNVQPKFGVEKKVLFTEEITFEDIIKKENVQKVNNLPEPKIQEEELEKEASAQFFISPVQLEKEHHQDPVPVFQKQKKTISVPYPNQQYYKKHKLFYDYFFNNIPEKRNRSSNRAKK